MGSILFMGRRGAGNIINACIIQELSTHSDHLSPGTDLHQEETRTHCTSTRSEVRGTSSWYLTAVRVLLTVEICVTLQINTDPPPPIFHTSVHRHPALICEENRATVADLPIMMNKQCSGCTVLGCGQVPLEDTDATLMESVSDSVVRNTHQQPVVIL